jgi:formate hydrogenlyase transcriptional activator
MASRGHAGPRHDTVAGAASGSADPIGDDDRLAFERLLVDLLVTFGDVAPAGIAGAIERSLARLTAFLGFDRAAYTEFLPDGAIEVLCATANGGLEAVPVGPFPLVLPWWRGELEAGRIVARSDLPFDLPPQAVEEVRYVTAVGMKAHLGIPIVVNGRTVAMVGFDAHTAARPWPDDLVVRLKLVGEMFAQALARSRAEEKLAAALVEIRGLKERFEAENAGLRQATFTGPRPVLATRSPRFEEVLGEVRQVAPTNATVLLLGETGTGKEVIASLIHATSARAQRTLVKVNCAALPAPLVEAELFGREKGAYTGALARQMGRFEIADGSTIFLDEIGDLPLELQTKLLRVLQSGELERVGSTRTIRVDARIIAATHCDLAAAVEAGTFREDLYYRLNVFPVVLPALRERPEDIPTLAWAFVREFSESLGKSIERLAPESMAAMQAYRWPGNVRELRNAIERAMILARGPVLHVSLGRAPASRASDPLAARAPGVEATLRDSERAHILRALELSGWRIRGAGGAAERLDVKPTTLEARMARLGIRRVDSKHS